MVLRLMICAFVVLTGQVCFADGFASGISGALKSLAKKAEQQGMGTNLPIRVFPVVGCESGQIQMGMTRQVDALASDVFRVVEIDPKVIDAFNTQLQAVWGPAYDYNKITRKRGMAIPPAADLAGTFCKTRSGWELVLTLTDIGTRQKVSAQVTAKRPRTILLNMPQWMEAENGGEQQPMPRTLELALIDSLARAGFQIKSVQADSFLLSLASGMQNTTQSKQARFLADWAGCDLMLSGKVMVHWIASGQPRNLYGLATRRRVTYKAFPSLVLMDVWDEQDTFVLGSFQTTEGFRGDALSVREAAQKAVGAGIQPVWQSLAQALKRVSPSQ